MLAMYPENRGLMSSPEVAKQYILGGKGVVTLESPSGIHHTYHFKRPQNPNNFPEDIIFVYAVHQQQKLFYVGMIENGAFRLTTNSRFLNDTPIVRGARYIMRMIDEPDLMNKTEMKLYHEGVCSVCGRKLTSPKSISIGVGPKCLRRHL